MLILDTRIDNFSRQDIFDTVGNFLRGDTFHQIATVNPEFLLLARRDAMFRDLLNGCDLNIADGVGLRFASWLQSIRLKSRVPGVDLMHHILRSAQELGLKVFLVAREGGLSHWKDTAIALAALYPDLRVNGMDVSIFATETSPEEQALFQEMIRHEIVLCNFGAPYQEIFLADIRNNPGQVRLAMGVGGSFDFVTGKVRRAPRWMRTIGLEWLWRLILQPRRWKRITNAVILFPLIALLNRTRTHKS